MGEKAVVTIDDRELKNWVTNSRKQLPVVSNKATERIALKNKAELRREISLRFLKWKGTLWNSVTAKSAFSSDNETIWEVSMEEYGIMLNNMTPHWVSVTKNPVLAAWAEQKYGKFRFSGGGKVPRSLFIQAPHARGWFDKAFERANKDEVLGKIIDEELEVILK